MKGFGEGHDLHYLPPLEPTRQRRNGGAGLCVLQPGAALAIQRTAAHLPEARTGTDCNGCEAKGGAAC